MKKVQYITFLLWILSVTGMVICFSPGRIEAADMSSDGRSISWVSSGKAGSGGLRYQSIGWKFTIRSAVGEKVKEKSITYYLGNALAAGYGQSGAISRSGLNINGLIINTHRVKLDRLKKDTGIDPARGSVSITADAVIEIYKGSKSIGVYKTKKAANAAVKSKGFRSDFDHDYQGYYDQNVRFDYYYLEVKKGIGIKSVSPKSGWVKKGSSAACRAVEKSGYVCKGWKMTFYSGKDARKKTVEGNLAVIAEIDGNCSVCAQAAPVMYQVKFVGNKSSSGRMAEQKLSCVRAETLNANKFKRKGYRFTGWNTAASGKGKSYRDRAKVKNLSGGQAKTVILYAQWKKKPVPKPDGIPEPLPGGEPEPEESGTEEPGSEDPEPESEEPGSEEPGTEEPESEEPGTEEPGTEKPGTEDPEPESEEPGTEEPESGEPETEDPEEEENTPPDIVACDRYVALKEAQAGRITEEFLLERASARDREDGLIRHGSGAGGDFLVEDFDEMRFTALSGQSVVPVTFKAIDSGGLTAGKRIAVYVVDTRAHMDPGGRERLRFISPDYLDETGENGGLDIDSPWRWEEEKERILRAAGGKEEKK